MVSLLVGLSVIVTFCSAARNFADYDHDYSNIVDDDDNKNTLSSWVIVVIVSICVVVVSSIVVLIVCCLCCSTRRASPDQVVHTVSGRDITLTVFSGQSSSISKITDESIGHTNACFTEPQPSTSIGSKAGYTKTGLTQIQPSMSTSGITPGQSTFTPSGQPNGYTNIAFAPSQHPINASLSTSGLLSPSTETGPQITEQPPPYSEKPVTMVTKPSI